MLPGAPSPDLTEPPWVRPRWFPVVGPVVLGLFRVLGTLGAARRQPDRAPARTVRSSSAWSSSSWSA